MPFPATRLALPYVGASRDQGSRATARADPQVRGFVRRGEFSHRHFRTHVLRRLQCRDLPGLPQKTVTASLESKAHDHRARQRPLSPRPATGSVPTQMPACALIAVSPALQSPARLDRAGLEAHASTRGAQPLLRYVRRATRRREHLLRCLAATLLGAGASMLHNLRRYV